MLRARRRRLPRLLMALMIFFGTLFLVGVGPASAHATVASSDPIDGSDLARGPAQVSITFDESVGLNPGYLRVIDGSGRRVDSGEAFHPDGRGPVVAVRLQGNLPRAAYLISYRVISADSHPVSGVVRFGVGGASLSAVSGDVGGGTDSGVSLLLTIARALSFVGLAVAGGWWLLIWLATRREDDPKPGSWPPAARRLVVGGLAGALIGAFLELIGQGPYAAGESVAGIGHLNLLADTLASSFGRWHLAQIALLAVLLVAVLGRVYLDAGRRPTPLWIGGSVLWLAVLGCVAATGHAAVRSPIWLGEVSTIVHLAAVTAWIGGLVVLGAVVLAREAADLDDGDAPHGTDDADADADAPHTDAMDDYDADTEYDLDYVDDLAEWDGRHSAAPVALAAFSPVALVSVAAIAATGTYQAWQEVGAWRAFVDSEYGALVLVKIGLFVILIGLGALARTRMRAGAAEGDGESVARLRVGVLVEVLLAVAVLVVTAVLVAQPPGRTATADATTPAVVTAGVALSPDRQLSLEVRPSRHGPVTVLITVGPGAAVEKMTLTATLPSQSIGPIPVPLTAIDDLAFQSTAVDLPVAGIWQFSVAVQTSAFDITTATLPVTLR